MKEVFKDSMTIVFEDENGNTFGIIKDNTKKDYYTVTARKAGQKGNTVATKCLYDKAIEIINTLSKEYK